jgi:hypothetical protein
MIIFLVIVIGMDMITVTVPGFYQGYSEGRGADFIPSGLKKPLTLVKGKVPLRNTGQLAWYRLGEIS